jgi:hypothetical protein
MEEIVEQHWRGRLTAVASPTIAGTYGRVKLRAIPPGDRQGHEDYRAIDTSYWPRMFDLI